MRKKRKAVYVDPLVLGIIFNIAWSIFVFSQAPIHFLEFPSHRLAIGWPVLSKLVLVACFAFPTLTSFCLMQAVKRRSWNEFLKKIYVILLVVLQLPLLAFGSVLFVVASHGLRLNSKINVYRSPQGKYSLDMQSSSDGCTYSIYQNRGWHQAYIDDIQLYRSCNFEGMNWQWNEDETQLRWQSAEEEDRYEGENGIVELPGD